MNQDQRPYAFATDRWFNVEVTLRRVADGSSRSRFVFAALAALLLAFTIAPRVDAQIVGGGEGEPKEERLCEDGKPPDETGQCARPVAEPCEDGTFPKEGEECPQPQQNPCPDGEDFCEQIASCPTDGPLPPGSRCEVASAPTTTAPEPVAPAPAPTSDGADVRGRVVDQPAPVTGAPPAPAPAPAAGGEDLARTGATETWLAAVGSALMIIGWMLLRISRRSAAFAR